MRYVFAIVCALVLGLGILFGALNAELVQVDLYFQAFSLSLGSALLLAALLGAVAGGLCLWLTVILPQRRQVRRLQRAVASRPTETSAGEITSAGV